jgi:hypothetical protein
VLSAQSIDIEGAGAAGRRVRFWRGKHALGSGLPSADVLGTTWEPSKAIRVIFAMLAVEQMRRLGNLANASSGFDPVIVPMYRLR